MRQAEARWIGATLARLPLCDRGPLVNIGSSTREFREVKQPHIDHLVFAPLRAAGLAVIHTDLKMGDGIDVPGDLRDESVQSRLRAASPRVVLCSNVLEHVVHPHQVASIIESLLPRGGHAIITVPRSYPYHPDPIDTGFRPTPPELMSLFPSCSLVEGVVVEDRSFGHEIVRGGRAGLSKGTRTILGALRVGNEVARAQRDKLRWLLRPFSTTCILIRAQ